MTTDPFDDLRPYNDSEINDAMIRITENPHFRALAAYLYPDTPLEELKAFFRGIHTVDQFQQQVMKQAVRTLVKRTMNEFTYSGIEHLRPDQSYLFISNHRDIVLDSALLQVILAENSLPTSEITFGSNLMQGEFVIDLGKSNKMFRVNRGGTAREFYQNSIRHSLYIRHTLLDKRESVWIAQRNGRTKDGNDATDQGLMKMLTLCENADVLSSLAGLNIVPLSISYQYETCDNLKTRELYLSQRQRYLKAPGEDLHSILSGLQEFKGNVHLEITPPITPDELDVFRSFERNEKLAAVAQLIDKRIYKGYRLWDTHYIAYDMLYNTFEYTSHYTPEAYKAFAQRMHDRLQSFEGDQVELMTLFLKIYSNPILNIC